MKKNKMGEKGKEGKEKEGGGAVRASGDCGRGRPRVASPRECGLGGWARGQEGREEKGEREKEGARFAAAGRDASRWMGKDGTRIEFGCRVVQKKNLGLGFRVLGGVELNDEKQF